MKSNNSRAPYVKAMVGSLLDDSLRHDKPKIFVAPIAAGEKVVATSKKDTARLLKSMYGDAVAVEMEGRGFLESVHLNADVRGGVVRGISDLLDGKAAADRAGSQQRAADAASAAAFEILAGLDGGSARAATAPVISFRERPSTFSKAAYFEKHDVLAKVGVPGVDEVLFSYADGPHAYLRVLPGNDPEVRIPLARLRNSAQHAPLLRASGFGGFVSLNDYGVAIYDPAGAHSGGSADLHLATQLFQTGELWSMSDLIIVRERAGRPAWVPIPYLPAFVLEKTFYTTAHAATSFAIEHMELKVPFQIEFGLIDVRGVHLGVRQNEIWDRIQTHEVVMRRILVRGERSEIDAALLEFFMKVFDGAGQERPAGLHSFPPGPPQPLNE
jgi:hypothetical protein